MCGPLVDSLAWIEIFSYRRIPGTVYSGERLVHQIVADGPFTALLLVAAIASEDQVQPVELMIWEQVARTKVIYGLFVWRRFVLRCDTRLSWLATLLAIGANGAEIAPQSVANSVAVMPGQVCPIDVCLTEFGDEIRFRRAWNRVDG